MYTFDKAMKHLLRDRGFVQTLFIIAVILVVAAVCFDIWIVYEIARVANSHTGDPETDQWNALIVLLWVVFFGIPAYLATFATAGLAVWARSRLKELNHQADGARDVTDKNRQDTQNESSTARPAAAALVQPFDPTNPAASSRPRGQHPAGKSARDIRILNLCLLLIALFTIPLLGHVLWAVMMKQYRMHVGLRLVLAVLSYVVGGIVAIYGLADIGPTGASSNWPLVIVGVLVLLAPFIYTFYKPLGQQNQA